MSTSTLAADAAASLRSRRTALGVSQQRLAELAGCSLSMVRVLESGYEPGTSHVLGRIVAVLNESSKHDAPGRRTQGVGKASDDGARPSD